MNRDTLRRIIGFAFVLNCFALEIRGSAPIANFIYRRPNSTVALNRQWHPSGAATTLPPNQWKNNNTNNWHRISYGQQYPDQQPQANWGGNPQQRHQENNPQLGWNMRLNASYTATTRAPNHSSALGPNTNWNWKVPQQYPGGVRSQNNTSDYWAALLNNTNHVTTAPPPLFNNGNNFGWNNNNNNNHNWRSQQQMPNSTANIWSSNPRFHGQQQPGGTEKFVEPHQTTPPPSSRAQQPGSNQPWTAVNNKPWSNGVTIQWNNTNNQWNQLDGGRTQPNTNVPLTPIASSRNTPQTQISNASFSPIDDSNNPFNRPQTGSGSPPFAPIGVDSGLWHSGNNYFGSNSASKAPLAPLSSDGTGFGPASLSYGYGQPQGRPVDDNKSHPYANLFNI